MPTALASLAHAAFDAFHHAVTEAPDLVIRPAVPILYFGDEPGYRRSPIKIVTVGLNPSDTEFPDGHRYVRFPRARSGRPDESYLAALNAYFQETPYLRWFNTYSGLLQGLEASFDGTQVNTALHTDLGSPVATTPTWSKLSPGARNELSAAGTRLWHDLLRELKPDVILASVARTWMDHIEFEAVEPWRELHVVTLNRKKPYVVTGRRVQLTPDHSSLLVWGQAAQTPFGSLSYADKRQVGGILQKLLTPPAEGDEHVA